MNDEGYRPSRRALLGCIRGDMCGGCGAGLRGGAGGSCAARETSVGCGMYSQRTGKSIDTIYFADGRYVPEALAGNQLLHARLAREPDDEVRRAQRRQPRRDASGDGQRRALHDDLGLPDPRPTRMLPAAPPATPLHLRAMAADVRLPAAAASGKSRARPSPATAAASASTTARTSSTWIAGRSVPGTADVPLRREECRRVVNGNC